MEFYEAYKIVADMWPQEIDISCLVSHPNGGATIQELIDAHDTVEEQCLALGKEAVTMDWSLFQYFHSKAKTLNERNISILNTKDVNISELKELYNGNL